MPATIQSASSAACVPERSPRVTNGAPLASIAFSAVAMSLPFTPAGSLFGPISTIVVVHHVEALHGKTVGDEFLFLRPCVHQHDVGLAASRAIEHLVGAPRDHLHVDAGLGT